MSEDRTTYVPGKRASLVILILLISVNTFWFTHQIQFGPLIGLVFYAVVALLIWRNDNFSSGTIAGIVGFTVHLIELFFFDMSTQDLIIIGFYLANLVLPLILLNFSLKAYRSVRGLEEDE